MERIIIEQCAPTLAALKCGSLFAVKKEEGNQVVCWQAALAFYGLALIPLPARGSYRQLYLCRPAMVEGELMRPEVRGYLHEIGYREFACYPAVEHLIGRMGRKTFPHEIGLFLGYPVEDVVGFSTQGGKGYRFAGDWKVYGDVRAAQNRFAVYRACREAYLARWEQGEDLLDLIGTSIVSS